MLKIIRVSFLLAFNMIGLLLLTGNGFSQSRSEAQNSVIEYMNEAHAKYLPGVFTEFFEQLVKFKIRNFRFTILIIS